MATDLTVILDDRPGALAEMGEALGRAGVNIDGICGVAAGGRSPVHILVEDPETARSALSGAGIEITDERDVVTMRFENRPGELGEMTRKVADAGANIELVYIGCDNVLVLATSDNAALAGLS